LLSGCGEGSETDAESVSEISRAIIGGTYDPLARPEVVSFQNTDHGCTATMLSRRHFLTASHCIDHRARWLGGDIYVTDGTPPYPLWSVDDVYSFGWYVEEDPSKPFDLALGRMLTDIPASLATPAVIADRDPIGGEMATAMGYGCSAQGAGDGGFKRYREYPYPPNTISCGGDSGGPHFAGNLVSRGEIIAVTSGSRVGGGLPDIVALPGSVKSRIEATMRSLDDAPGTGEPFESSTDRPGSDLPGMPIWASGKTFCHDLCTARPDCRAWTFIGSTAGTRCFLKSAVPNAVTTSGLTSGVILRGLETGLDRPGGDLGPPLTTPGPAGCRNECSRHATCRAFSWVTGGSCFLKSFSPRAYPNADVVSGLALGQGHFDLNGSNIGGAPLPGSHTADSCEHACAINTSCKAYTFVATDGKCWLKSAVPAAATCKNCISGIRKSQEPGVDRPGADLSGMPLTGKTANGCETACARRADCRAWTHVTSSGQCWLKGFVPTPFAGSGVTSGVRRGLEVNVSRSGTTLSTVDITQPIPEDCQSRCENTAQCTAWTLYTKQNGSQGNVNRCILQSTIGPRVTAYGAYSGRRGLYSF
jgi:hypothetical protein